MPGGLVLSKKYLILIAVLLLSVFSKGQDSIVVSLWKNGAPGFETKSKEPEQAKEWWVKNINNPSLTIFLPPAAIANGTAVIICPGGGFTNLVFDAEGIAAAKYLNGIGVTAFVLKYRLFREPNSPYKEENAKQDIFRAMRLVRSMAHDYQVDTARIGVMGFSAGGEVAGWVSYHYEDKNFVTPDATDLLPARPAFQVLVYPGPLAVPARVSPTAPPTFLLAANDDACCSEPLVQLLQMHRKANVPVEMHLYAKGNHAFNMGSRSALNSIHSWPQRLTDWLTDNNWLVKK